MAGDNYPSVRLWHREGKMVLMDKCNGLGVAVFTTNDEDREQEVSSGDITDRAQVRMAWRRFAHRPLCSDFSIGVENDIIEGVSE